MRYVSIPQAVSTIAIDKLGCGKGDDWSSVSIPQAVSTIAILKNIELVHGGRNEFQYRKR